MFVEHFKRQDQRFLHDPRTDFKAPVIKRSALGLVAVYNMLPTNILATKSVKLFQQQIQTMVSKYAQDGYPKWQEMISPRVSLETHPLVLLF